MRGINETVFCAMFSSLPASCKGLIVFGDLHYQLHSLVRILLHNCVGVPNFLWTNFGKDGQFKLLQIYVKSWAYEASARCSHKLELTSVPKPCIECPIFWTFTGNKQGTFPEGVKKYEKFSIYAKPVFSAFPNLKSTESTLWTKWKKKMKKDSVNIFPSVTSRKAGISTQK